MSEGLVVTSPGGVGPLSLALLLRNVADSAARRASDGAVGGADERTPPASAAAVDAFLRANKHWAMLPKRGDGPVPSAERALVREVRVPSHRAAADLLDAAAELGGRLSSTSRFPPQDPSMNRPLGTFLQATGSTTTSPSAPSSIAARQLLTNCKLTAHMNC